MINIIAGGTNFRHPTPFKLSRPNGFNHYVLLLIKSDCEFQIEDVTYSLPANCAVIIKPNTSYSYHNPKGEYVNDWLHFDVSEDLSPILNTIIPLGDIDVCSRILKQIFWEHSYTLSQYAPDNISCLFKVLINHLKSNHNHLDNKHMQMPFYSELCSIRLNLKNNVSEEHSIEKYAEKLHISKSYFQHLYSELFDVSFQQDVIEAKIEYAKNILHSSNAPISQVALMCGYNNEVHFHRQFKKVTCMTPAQYRKQL